MTRRLYHCAEARSMRSVWLLHELGLDFELVELGFDMKKLRSPEYLAIHPLGRVPCLVDGELVLFESGAICQYLCETYDDGTLHRAPGHPERARVAAVGALRRNDCGARREPGATERVHRAQRALRGGAQSRIASAGQGAGRRSMRTLQDRDYLLKSGFSAVDTGVGYSVHLAAQVHSARSVSARGRLLRAAASAPGVSRIAVETPQ